MNILEKTKIDKWKLDTEAAEISHLIATYDQEWNLALARLEKLNAKIDNLQDEIKNIKMQLLYKAKQAYKQCGFDKPPSDKLAESWSYTSPEYLEKFEELKELRLKRAEAISTENLLKCGHYVLLEKAHKIDLLTKQWAAQYFLTNNIGGASEEENNNVTEELNQTLRRRKKE